RRVAVTVPLLAPLLELPSLVVSLGVEYAKIASLQFGRGVNVTEQLPLTNVQLVALNAPARPVAVNATEPAGVVPPAPLASATVAVHVEAWLIATLAGLHTILVVVVRLLTVIVVLPLLAE